MDAGTALLAIGLIVGGIALYFVPTLVAGRRNHRNSGAILALNILLGWTFIGWALALVWALTDNTAPSASHQTEDPGRSTDGDYVL